VAPDLTSANRDLPSAPRSTIDRIRRVLVDALGLNVEHEQLTDETTLNDLAGLDSVAVLEFVVALEDEFGVELPPELLTLGFLGDLRRLASYIDARIVAAPRSG